MTGSSKGVPEQVVDVQGQLAGPQPGFRANHAKGIVCTGTFTAAPQAKTVSKAAHFQGHPVPVVVRFSNGGGVPSVHDGTPEVRGIAIKFSLPGGAVTDVLAISVEGFISRTVEDFLLFLKAKLPDPATGKPDADAVPRFLASHPAAKAFVGRLMEKPVPASYARVIYHANNALRFTAADGTSRFGRYHLIPKAGEAMLDPAEAAKRAAKFLQDELAERLATGPVEFTVQLQIANPGDTTDDATALWPADRRAVDLGTLRIAAISPTSAADERTLIFDPTTLTPGIDLSEDPLLLARSAAYSVSFERRNGKKA